MKKFVGRFVSVLLAILMLLAVSGCGNTGGSSSTPVPGEVLTRRARMLNLLIPVRKVINLLLPSRMKQTRFLSTWRMVSKTRLLRSEVL